MMKFKMMGERSMDPVHDTYFYICQVVFVLAIGYLVIKWLFSMMKAYRQLKNDKTEAELMLLKSKIDPHFFFNTLNNLYGLALEKSEKTPEVILKLSEIMRYTIYEGKNDTVALKDEVDYLQKYIEIHKLRYNKNVDVAFNTHIENETIKLAPLLLIMLLENAFKHGVESLIDEAYIRVDLKADESTITYTVENNFEKRTEADQGIGLDNLKRRLQLIYPNTHKFTTVSKNNTYIATLTLKAL